MHFCQSQLLSFLRQDNSCILKSDLEPLSSSRLLQLPIYRLTKSCEAKKVVGADAIGASAIEADAGNWGIACSLSFSSKPFVLRALSSSFAMAVTPVSQPPGPHLWIPLICPSPSFYSLSPVCGRENKVGLFVQLVSTSLIL